MVESELKKQKQIEVKLTELVHSVYSKLENSYGPNDVEIKELNK